MSNNLSSDIKTGFFWNSLSQFASQGIALLSMIILGRLLKPADFGILGMFTIFIAIANMVVDSGMGGYLIKKTNVTKDDYSTLFVYNLAISLLLYVILFLTAPVIAKFYDKDILISLIRIVGLVIIIHAFSIVQNTQILKELKFKILAAINCISAFVSLVIATLLAIKGYGVWALVFQQLSMAICITILLCFYNRFIPAIVFSVKSFKEQFVFGINLMLSSLLKTLTNNIVANIMAKITTLNQTGFFVQSNKLTESANQTITVIIDRSVFPVFAKIDNILEIKRAYIGLTKNMLSIMFPLCVLLALLSKPVILIMFGNKWIDAAWMLQILSFAMMPQIIQMLCRNLLKSRGNTKQIFLNETVKSVLVILSIIIGTFLGIKYMLWGIIVSQSIACFWIMYSVSNEIKYNYRQHISNVLILACISLLSYFGTILIMKITPVGNTVFNSLYGTGLMLSFVLILSAVFRQREIFNLIKKFRQLNS